MIATLRFDLDSEDDSENFKLAIQANAMSCVIFDIISYLRDTIKYSEGDMDNLIKARERISEILEDRKLDIDF